MLCFDFDLRGERSSIWLQDCQVATDVSNANAKVETVAKGSGKPVKDCEFADRQHNILISIFGCRHIFFSQFFNGFKLKKHIKKEFFSLSGTPLLGGFPYSVDMMGYAVSREYVRNL